MAGLKRDDVWRPFPQYVLRRHLTDVKCSLDKGFVLNEEKFVLAQVLDIWTRLTTGPAQLSLDHLSPFGVETVWQGLSDNPKLPESFILANAGQPLNYFKIGMFVSDEFMIANPGEEQISDDEENNIRWRDQYQRNAIIWDYSVRIHHQRLLQIEASEAQCPKFNITLNRLNTHNFFKFPRGISKYDWERYSRFLHFPVIIKIRTLALSSNKLDPFHWQSVSTNPYITLSDIKANMGLDWDWKMLSHHPNISMLEIASNPDLPWHAKSMLKNPNIFHSVYSATQ
jgi:hypothetical protein